MIKKLALLIAFAALAAVPAWGQTADGRTPAEEDVCDAFSGASFGLCNAYCEAMDCELLLDNDESTQPNASEQACLKIKLNFIKVSGLPSLPCEGSSCPEFDKPEGCPCNPSDNRCGADLLCDAELASPVCVPEEQDDVVEPT